MIRALSFAARHAIAAAGSVVGFTAFCGAAYFLLLLWAVLFDGGIGGPLALPFMLVAGFLASLSWTVLALFPVAATAEWISARWIRGSFLWQIPVASGLLVLWLAFLGGAHALLAGRGLAEGASSGAAAAAVLAIPLGAYWWLLQAGSALLRLAGSLARRLAARSPAAAFWAGD